MKNIRSAVLASTLAVSGTAVGAVPIDLTGYGYAEDVIVLPLIDVSISILDFGTINLFADNILAGSSVLFSLTDFDATGPVDASFSATDFATFDVSGATATARGDDTDMLQYLFEGVTDFSSDALGVDGGAVLLEISASGLSLTDGYFTDSASVTITRLSSIAQVPLPAGVVLLLSGLVGLGGFAARKRRRTV